MSILRNSVMLAETGRESVEDTLETVRNAIGRSRRVVSGVFTRGETRVDTLAGTRIPRFPVGGRTGTVLLAAVVVSLVLAVGFDIHPVGVLGVFTGIVAGDVLVKLVVAAGAVLAGFLAWGQARTVETASRTRRTITGLVTAGVAIGLSLWFGVVDFVFFASDIVLQTVTVGVGLTTAYIVWVKSRLVTEATETRAKATAITTGLVTTALAVGTGLIDPVLMVSNTVGDVVLTGAMAGVAAVTGLVSAASGRTMGAGRKGTAAAGMVGVLSGGFMAAAVAPAGVGIVAIVLTLVLENLLPAAMFGVGVVLFVTDPLKNVGPFAAKLALVIQLVAVAALAYIAASTLGDLNLPYLSVLPVLAVGGDTGDA